MSERQGMIDAGLASIDHYKARLPAWRYHVREALLPIIRAETPYAAWLQERMRSPFLDIYFAWTANLGTHTMYMIALPILFWFGNPFLARSMVYILAAGVYCSGFLKDLLCLPRPLSPPLTRISMSGSAALEYGFPSSHSTNAVSVAVFALLQLRKPGSSFTGNINVYLQGLAIFYALSIVLGRLYCGMHGFFDVVVGSLLGAAVGLAQYYVGPVRDQILFEGTIQSLIVGVIIALVLVRIHPEPVDNCPCYDDSVCFLAVIIGVDVGCWHFRRTSYADPLAWYPGSAPFSVSKLGWLRTMARVIVGVTTIISWRSTMKPLLLRNLPPVFRLIERLGLDSPRRFFTKASQYSTIPEQSSADNVLPSIKDFPSFVDNLRRRRALSVGPQSEADAYEALAYRQKRRRDSLRDTVPPTPDAPGSSGRDYFSGDSGTASHRRKRSISVEEFRRQMGASSNTLSPDSVLTPGFSNGTTNVNTELEDELDRKELFANIQKPRVRYDVEVVTKLIVYTGIAWLAVEGNPILFHHVGLGVY